MVWNFRPARPGATRRRLASSPTISTATTCWSADGKRAPALLQHGEQREAVEILLGQRAKALHRQERLQRHRLAVGGPHAAQADDQRTRLDPEPAGDEVVGRLGSLPEDA